MRGPTARTPTLAACACVLMVAGGCSSTLAPGESDFSVVAGDLVAVEEASLTKTRQATMAAMQHLGLRPHDRESDAMSALIVGEILVGVIPQSREIRVRLERVSESRTRITMRILFTRSRERLEFVLAEIRRQLTD